MVCNWKYAFIHSNTSIYDNFVWNGRYYPWGRGFEGWCHFKTIEDFNGRHMLGGFNQNRIIGIFQEFRDDKMNGIGGRGGGGGGRLMRGQDWFPYWSYQVYAWVSAMHFSRRYGNFHPRLCMDWFIFGLCVLHIKR